MAGNLDSEIYGYISRLNRISQELEQQADEIEASIKGMSTGRYTRALRDCAEKYKKAKNNLQKIVNQ